MTPSPRSWRERYRQRLFRTIAADREAVVLRHSRIYVLPTRRGLAFIATLAIMLVTSLNYSLALGFVVTFLCTGFAAAALLHTYRNLAGIELRPLAAGEAFAGGALPFKLAVERRARPRFAIALSARGCEPTTIDATDDTTFPATLQVRAPRRGSIVLGRITLSSTYPVGLWRAWAYVHFPLAGVAFPAPEVSPPPLPAGSAGHETRAAARGDDSDLAGLRAYQAGDPLQRVAWKAVARGAGWHTKQFEGGGGGGPVDLAWNRTASVHDPERKIARLTAWVLAAERAARPFTLSVPGFQLPAGQGREHRRKALTALALLPPSPA